MTALHAIVSLSIARSSAFSIRAGRTGRTYLTTHTTPSQICVSERAPCLATVLRSCVSSTNDATSINLILDLFSLAVRRPCKRSSANTSIACLRYLFWLLVSLAIRRVGRGLLRGPTGGGQSRQLLVLQCSVHSYRYQTHMEMHQADGGECRAHS